MMHLTTILSTLTLPLLALTSPIQPRNTSLPITIRECGNTLPRYQLEKLAKLISTLPPTINHRSMERLQFQFNVTEDTCLQVQTYNWSCDHDITVTGPGLAYAILGISDGCKDQLGAGEGSRFGWGYYRDLETGTEY